MRYYDPDMFQYANVIKQFRKLTVHEMSFSGKIVGSTNFKNAYRQPSYSLLKIPVQKDTLFQALNSKVVYSFFKDSRR